MNTSDSRFEPIHAHFRPVEPERVRELEAKLGSPLPPEYVDFLTRYGGCGFSGDASIRAGGRRLPLFTFFDERKLLANLEIYSDLAAEGRLAFADDMGGNPFVLDAGRGSVYFIDFAANPAIGMKVADSFAAFLGSVDVCRFEDEIDHDTGD